MENVHVNPIVVERKIRYRFRVAWWLTAMVIYQILMITLNVTSELSRRRKSPGGRLIRRMEIYVPVDVCCVRISVRGSRLTPAKDLLEIVTTGELGDTARHGAFEQSRFRCRQDPVHLIRCAASLAGAGRPRQLNRGVCAQRVAVSQGGSVSVDSEEGGARSIENTQDGRFRLVVGSRLAYRRRKIRGRRLGRRIPVRLGSLPKVLTAVIKHSRPK